MHETNEKKIILIPLFMIILFVMIITILVLSVKAICFSNNSESEENVIPAKIEEEKEIEIEEEKDIEEINTQEIESEEEQKEVPAQSTEKVKSYTASNGQNYDSIGILNIPSLNIQYPILSSTSEQTLKVALTKYWGGNPNEVGNLCISGHNYKNSKFLVNYKI